MHIALIWVGFGEGSSHLGLMYVAFFYISVKDSFRKITRNKIYHFLHKWWLADLHVSNVVVNTIRHMMEGNKSDYLLYTSDVVLQSRMMPGRHRPFPAFLFQVGRIFLLLLFSVTMDVFLFHLFVLCVSRCRS
jgi:hypothetical protein